MTFETSFSRSSKKSDAALLLFFQDAKLGAEGKKLDKASGGYISQVLKKGNFTGKQGEAAVLTMPKGPYGQIVLGGLGPAKKITPVQAEDAGGKLYNVIARTGPSVVLLLDTEDKNLRAADLAARFVYGMQLRSYTFDKYKSKKADKKAKDKSFKKFSVATSKATEAERLYKRLAATASGVFLARDLVNEPPNEIVPDMFAKRIVKELKPLGVSIEVLDEKQMKKLGMGAILAVGIGSENMPRMVTMRWNGGKKGDRPLALVGKGVTFDTGGISIKPAAGMEDMKMDMAGAAAVVGTMKAIAKRKAKANVVGIVGLAENMVSGRATRPSDIITSYAGKTIEVLNTDAEGRLVLADALTYVQEKHKPRAIIDLATLTGAMMIALGMEYCGVFANDDKHWSNIEAAGKSTGEKIWRMPLDDLWRKEMEGSVADLQNLAKSGRFAGACTAAGFLEHFIENNTPWAHMDIAGTAWIKSERPTVTRYGTGFGVRLLDRMIADSYEKG